MKLVSMDSFALKYRPQYIEEFCLTPPFKIFLRSLLEIDDLNLLLVGNICSGKSTLLNILIREYYHISKDEDIPQMNILYINNLKEQGINFFRSEIKTFSQSCSTIRGKKKMIIVDDIDTINEQGQQVFRNYIDKYKHNIHFLSVCTNVQKVIESMQSRLHIIRIDMPSDMQMNHLLNRIVLNEKIEIDEESKTFILTYCNHSIRSMIGYLEKIKILNQPITLELCDKIVTEISFRQFEKYTLYLCENKLKDAIYVLYDIYDLGFSVIDIFEYLFIFIKTTNILTEDKKYKIIISLCKFITIIYSVHEDVIELALFTAEISKNFSIVEKSP
jgi:replication factor C subunit 2/4